MIPTTEIDRIKQQISITDVLASRGIQPVRQTRKELTYRSPLRDDKTPSFYVNVLTNVFHDVVVDAHRGDVIRLVQLLDSVAFVDAVQKLLDFEGLPDKPSFFLSGSLSTPTASKEKIRDVKYVHNPALLCYAESRGIDISLSRTYLREIHYTHDGRYYYALGFLNDSEGYALRNGVGCKRNIGLNDISTISGTRSDSMNCNIFEGFFDFLSALQHFNLAVPTHKTYVLNSVSNLSKVIAHLSQYSQLNVYFDQDKAGRDAFGTLQKHNFPVFDRSGLYQGHADFNEFLVAQKTATPLALSSTPIVLSVS